MRGNQNLQVEHFDLHDVDFYIVNFEKFTRMCKEKWFRGYSPGFPLIREVDASEGAKARQRTSRPGRKSSFCYFARDPLGKSLVTLPAAGQLQMC